MTSTSGSHENDAPTAAVSRVPSRTKIADEKQEKQELETKGVPEKQDSVQNEEADPDTDEGVHVNYPSTTALALLTIGLCLVIFVVSALLSSFRFTQTLISMLFDDDRLHLTTRSLVRASLNT